MPKNGISGIFDIKKTGISGFSPLSRGYWAS
jgi:hypothetical protein